MIRSRQRHHEHRGGLLLHLKRGLVGTFHHVGEQHLHRYMKEFDFRYNTRSALGVEDCERADLALKGIQREAFDLITD